MRLRLARTGGLGRYHRGVSGDSSTEVSSNPSPLGNNKSTTIVVAVLVAWSFFVYRHGLDSLPRGDQLPFLDERARFPATGAWLLHAISYTRTRILTGDSHLMFRPLHGFVLGVQEVFLPDDALAQGLVSIVLHAAVVLVLYFLVRWVADPVVAFLAAIVYATEYPGMEMVLWRHISPYLLAPLLLGVGLHALRRVWAGGRSWLAAVPWLLLACSVHEAVPVAFVAAITAIVIARSRAVDRAPLDAVAKALAAACVLWLALDAFDLFLHPTPVMAGPNDALPADFVQVVASLLQFFGLCMVAMLAPSVVDLRWNGPERAFSRLQWDYTVVPQAVSASVGIATLVFLFAAVVWSARRIARGDARGLAPLLLASFAMAIGVAFAGVRTAGSFGYFANATYYCHLTSFVFLLIGSPALAAARVSRRRTLVTAGAVVLAGAWSLSSYLCIQQALRAQEPFARLSLSTAAAVRQAMERRPDLCVGGILDASARDAISPPRGPLTLLGATACAYRRDARPVYLDRVDGRYALVSLPPPDDLHPVTFDSSPGWIVEGSAAHAEADAADTVSIFGSATARPTEVDVRVDGAQDGGLWLGYRSPSAYTAIAFFEGAHIEAWIRDGEAPRAVPFQTFGAIRDRSFALRVRMVDDRAIVFSDGTLVGTLEAPDLEGRVGLFHHGAGAQVFRDLQMGEATAPPPVVEVPLDLSLAGLPDALARLSH
jgi:hypothetical protein